MSKVSTDPIADMLTRIRNAIAVNKHEISLPHSKVKEAVARLLVERKFLVAVTVEDMTIGKLMTITINQPGTNAHITEIVRLSKPGRREYRGADKIPTVKRGRGLVIVSTSKGMIAGIDARNQGVGGELICKVY
jgi:small subunit ribosomal protein S8